MPSAIGQHGADLGQVGAAVVEPLDAALEDAGDLVWLDLHWVSVLLLGGLRATCFRSCSSLFRTLASSTMLPDLQHEAAEHVGVDVRGQLDPAAGLLLDPLADAP